MWIHQNLQSNASNEGHVVPRQDRLSSASLTKRPVPSPRLLCSWIASRLRFYDSAVGFVGMDKDAIRRSLCTPYHALHRALQQCTAAAPAAGCGCLFISSDFLGRLT